MPASITNHGAYGSVFFGARILQILAASAIAVISVVFIVKLSGIETSASVLAIPISSFAVFALVTLYSGFSFLSYWGKDSVFKNFYLMDLGVDIVTIALAAVLGLYMSPINCASIGQPDGSAASAWDLAVALGSDMLGNPGATTFTALACASQQGCIAWKAAYGLMIELA
jgi:hypothetical protein